MAYFTLINKENVVFQVMNLDNAILLDENGIEVEQKGVDYLEKEFNVKKIFPETVLIKQCSYNGNFRGCYAGIGFTYDAVNDVFVAPINEEEINDIKI